LVLVEQMQSEPEPKILDIGEFQLVFEGQVDDPRTPGRVDQYLALIEDAISSRQLEYSFYHGDRVVVVSNLTIELDEIVDGSIVAKAKMVGSFLLGTYGAIAVYPSFREAVPIITQDVSAAVEYVVENAPDQEEDLPPPIKVELFLKEDEEIEDQLDELLF